MAGKNYGRVEEIFRKGVLAFDQERYSEALEHFRAAADEGHAVTSWAIGTMYALGLGVARDDAAVRAWYSRGADWGHVYAHDADRQWANENISIPDDQVTAWLARAPDHAEAQYQLGRMHANGWGVARDFAAAMAWYRKAAAQDNPEAMRRIAQMYLFAEGVAKNDAEAELWLEKATACENREE